MNLSQCEWQDLLSVDFHSKFLFNIEFIHLTSIIVSKETRFQYMPRVPIQIITFFCSSVHKHQIQNIHIHAVEVLNLMNFLPFYLYFFFLLLCFSLYKYRIERFVVIFVCSVTSSAHNEKEKTNSICTTSLTVFFSFKSLISVTHSYCDINTNSIYLFLWRQFILLSYLILLLCKFLLTFNCITLCHIHICDDEEMLNGTYFFQYPFSAVCNFFLLKCMFTVCASDFN